MKRVLASIPKYIVSRSFGWPKQLPINLTITPSPRCNSRCATCNIWRNKEDELTLEEWSRIFRSLGPTPFWCTISGGEPFLYRDLAALCQSLYRWCRPGIINIPTNSLLYRTIPDKVEEICRSCPDSKIIINLSLDGVGESHDRIRGVKGNFECFEQNYRSLKKMSYPNLTVGVHSVISRLNVEDAPALFAYAFSLEPDSYITEIAEQRVELGTVGTDITPSADQYSAVIDQLIDRLDISQFHGISKVTEAFRAEYYQLVKRILSEKAQVIPCYAGWASAHIYANGDVWPCCVRADNIGNLRKANYDLARIWFSDPADRARETIRRKDCHCALANAGYTNMLMHVPTSARVGARVLLSSLLAGGRSTRSEAALTSPHNRL